MPPPPKPTVAPVQLEDNTDEPMAAPAVLAAAPAPPTSARPVAPAKPPRSAPRLDGDRRLGTQRHRMRYVQFQLTPELSERLTARANTEDVVLGEVVMDAVRTYGNRPAEEPRRRRRREQVAVRRSVLVRPEEANQIAEVAERCEETPSALIRRCLELHLVLGS